MPTQPREYAQIVFRKAKQFSVNRIVPAPQLVMHAFPGPKLHAIGSAEPIIFASRSACMLSPQQQFLNV
jgi:hypothetical protein